MITRDDIRGAYRFILGRPPASDAVIDEHLKHVTDLPSLRSRLLSDPEFYKTNARELLRYLAVSEAQRQPSSVEYECSPVELAALFAHIKTVWSKLGEIEPHFSVFSNPNFKPENLDANMGAFFRSGQSEARLLTTELLGAGLKASGYQNCLELGSGVGRVTRYLANVATNVMGYDISQPHLDLAKTYMATENVTNVTLRQITEPSAVEFPASDLFYSRIVLQHNPPPIMRFLIQRALAALVPGGVAVFQLPVYIEGYNFSVSDYVSGMDKLDNQELHALPQKAIFSAIADANCDVLSCYRDNSLARITQISNRFVVQKRSNP